MTFYEDESRGTKQNVNHNFCYICYMLRCLFTSHLGRQVCRYIHGKYTQITVALCTTFNQKGAKNFVQTFHPFLHWKKGSTMEIKYKDSPKQYVCTICFQNAFLCQKFSKFQQVPMLNKISIYRFTQMFGFDKKKSIQLGGMGNWKLPHCPFMLISLRVPESIVTYHSEVITKANGSTDLPN